MSHIHEREPTVNFALALIIDQRQCSHEEAREVLCRLSQQRHTRISELSRQIVRRTLPIPIR
jgi:AmiR/NasT family two-component response regulator